MLLDKVKLVGLLVKSCLGSKEARELLCVSGKSKQGRPLSPEFKML